MDIRLSPSQRQPTRLITASEDDTSPIVMVWDLRNSLAPEKVKCFAIAHVSHSS
jgi:hypothetical protein